MWARSYGLLQDPAFKSYLSRLSKRPAFQKAFADAALFKPQVPGDAPLVKRFTG